MNAKQARRIRQALRRAGLDFRQREYWQKFKRNRSVLVGTNPDGTEQRIDVPRHETRIDPRSGRGMYRAAKRVPELLKFLGNVHAVA